MPDETPQRLVEITLFGKPPNCTGEIASVLFDTISESSDDEYAAGATDALESFLLSLACEGLTPDDPKVMKALTSALDALTNNADHGKAPVVYDAYDLARVDKDMLSVRARRVIEQTGCTTVAELAAYGIKRLFNAQGSGKLPVIEIARWLEGHFGLRLAA